MKLTEEDIFLSDGDVGREYLSINIHQSQSEFDNLKQQILEHYRIVNELLLHYKHSHPSDSDLRSFVEEIIKTATGKDIQEIQSQETVEND